MRGFVPIIAGDGRPDNRRADGRDGLAPVEGSWRSGQTATTKGCPADGGPGLRTAYVFLGESNRERKGLGGSLGRRLREGRSGPASGPATASGEQPKPRPAPLGPPGIEAWRVGPQDSCDHRAARSSSSPGRPAGRKTPSGPRGVSGTRVSPRRRKTVRDWASGSTIQYSATPWRS